MVLIVRKNEKKSFQKSSPLIQIRTDYNQHYCLYENLPIGSRLKMSLNEGMIVQVKCRDTLVSKKKNNFIPERNFYILLLYFTIDCQEIIDAIYISNDCCSCKIASKHECKTSESSHQCIVNISSTICSTQEVATLTQEMVNQIYCLY